MTAINFNTAAATVISNEPTHRVYTRATWGDSWTLRADLICLQSIWQAAPNNSTATLYRDYGRSLAHGGTSLVDRSKLTIEGHFVLVEWDNDESGINYWLGIVDSSLDSPDGATDGTIPASGSQSFACFGMERILQLAPIVDTVWKKGTASTRSGGATEFNKDGKPNRSASVIASETYVFEADSDTAEFWSTRDIVNHLLFYHLPTNDGQAATIPWVLANASIVPNWDAPTIDPEGQTIYNLLTELLDQRKLLGWAAGFDNTSLTVAPFSISASDITLVDVTFPQNATQHVFTYSADPLTTGEITIDRSDMVDQVIVRGSRRQSVCTLSYSAAELYKTWDSTAETAYLAGASAETGYGDLDVIDQREANDRVRRQEYEDVFQKFALAASWDFQVYDADGVDDLSRVFEMDDPEDTDPYEPFLGTLRLEPYIPLLKGFDYAGDLSAVPVSYGTFFRPPMITLTLPGLSTDHIDVIEIGQTLKVFANGQTIDYTISVDVEPDARAIRLAINGAPQHMLSLGSTLLDADDKLSGAWTLDNMRATVCFTEDRYCEAKYPESLSTADVIRRRVFHVGDAYQKIYVVPNTVVALAFDRSEVYSDGGYLRDDTPKLIYLARLLASYHTAPRVTMALTTHRRTGLCSVGDMVASANGTNVGSVVTKIQVDSPLGQGSNAEKATQTIVATSSPIDLLATLSIVQSRIARR